ncbi:coiled-coil domain-containing protein 66 [Mixophyes fleayi]|uniref:coiled-coil domain-containing protein 66 n=1 Tax=Mixophyes fleayi TaxID=3061075 RepID=UPI003F4DBF01
MNLGDGLKLETQILNGKTKLILAPYGVQEKVGKQAGNRGRTHKAIVKIKTPAQVLHSIQSNNSKTEPPVLKPRSGIGGGVYSKPPANVLKELENKHHDPIMHQNVQQAKPDAGKAKPIPKKASNGPKQRLQQKPAISADELRESLVCLTQEQFQQILMTINQGGKPITEEQTNDIDLDKQEMENIAQPPIAEEEDANGGISEDKNYLRTAEQATDVQTSNLFSTLGERERDKSLQEAKKVQWRRELDEQVALKKRLKEADQDGINVRLREIHSRESSASERTPFSDLPKSTPLNYGTPDQEDSIFKTPTVTETTDSSPVGRASSFSSPELPAAIRSAFVLGEAAPLDHPFSAVKRQQQKKWLEELNKQREEDTLRKVQEKQKFQETVEQDHWAKHFDSFKKQTDSQTPAYQITATFQQYETPPSTSGPAPVEPSPAASPFHQERAETQKSTEEGHFQSQKSGFLRTMTSLLDPVQIEERDRKRVKQLEHQKAIAAQVEQKRQKKQLEDEQRQQEEQEEERRLARDREQMQKQYEEDSFRQKQKEEVLNQKTKELYQSMQRAQEEAQRLKQEQRMRHLLQKGHDVSKLQKNIAGDAVNQDLSRAASRSTGIIWDDYQSATNSVVKQSITALTSPRKDTAVQTDDLDVLTKSDFVSNSKGTTWRHEQNASPDIPVEFNDEQPKAELQTRKILRDRNDSSKENTNIYNDVYDPFARTEKQVREHGRKPDWNKNKPHKKYVKASERYPKGLQKQREESKVRRQMELLHLVEKNSSNNPQVKKGNSPEKSPVPQDQAKVSRPQEHVKIVPESKKEEKIQKVDSNFKRSDSPPVPAVKNRLYQAQKRSTVTPAPSVYNGSTLSPQWNVSPSLDKQESERPPSSQFIPYVRTKEIYYLDPDAPMSRPSTHDPQYKRIGTDQESRQIFSSDHVSDPLLNPHIVRNKDRQQAILRGLSELRKGLLQKQKELETGLMPDV